MALEHALPGEPVDITPLGPALATATTHAILKTHALELMRVVLRTGEALPPHEVQGELTLFCIEGEAEVTWAERPFVLHAGQLVLLPAGERHAVRALQDTSMLLTIQLPPGAPGSASSTH